MPIALSGSSGWARGLLRGVAPRVVALGMVATAGGCGGNMGSGSTCGPTRATVARVIDGDTIELTDGSRVRYLLVDTPESTSEQECFGAEAKAFNESLVAGTQVSLTYDVECRDRFDRLLAYVSVDGREVNALLLERGYACVLYIPPNGSDRVTAYTDLADAAAAAGAGLWGACAEELPC